MPDGEPGWRLTKFRKQLALTFEDDRGKRHRFSLGTADPSEAKRLAPAVYAELTRPKGTTVADLWKAYTLDKAGRSVVITMKFTWKALEPHFGHRPGETISKAECEAYTAARRRAGRSDGSIHTELGHLRTVLVWAQKQRLIKLAPDIARPRKPEPRDRYLTKQEAQRILDAASLPHVRLVIHLMLATAARISALLDLKWDRVDIKRRLIHLRDPEDAARRKGRAIVPINKTLFAALQDARQGALSDFVVEWGGKPVKSVKRAIAFAAAKAGFEPGTFDEEVFRRWSPILRGPWRFGFDEKGEGNEVERVMRMLREVSPRRKQVYTMIGHEPFDVCMDRIRRVIGWGGEPYAQPFMQLNTLEKRPKVRHDWTELKLRQVARWVNRHIWRKTPFAEYDASAKTPRAIDHTWDGMLFEGHAE